MDGRCAERVVFSVLFNESEEFLAALIRNFQRFTDHRCILIVSLAPGRGLAGTWAAPARVILRHGAVARRKLGHTLLAGHLENYDLALTQVPDFSFFCPIASNSLFVRAFDVPAAIAAQGSERAMQFIDIDALPDHWWYPQIKRNPEFLAALKARWGITKIGSAQIEGFFASRDDWALLHARLAEILDIGAALHADALFPLEEVLPVVVFTQFGSGKITRVCHNFHGKLDVEVSDMLRVGEKFPPPLALMKWFARDEAVLETALVTQGWSGDVLAALQQDIAANRVAEVLRKRHALVALAEALGDFEHFVPLEAAWRMHGRYHEPQLRALRQALVPWPVPGGGPEAADSWVLMEHTGHEIALTLTAAPGQGLGIACTGAAGIVEGYWYLRLPAAQRVMLRFTMALEGARKFAALLGWILFRAGDDASPARLHHQGREGAEMAFYSLHEAAGDKVLWLGLPIMAGAALSLGVAVMVLEG